MAFASSILYAFFLVQFTLGSSAPEIIKETMRNVHKDVVKTKEYTDGRRGLDPDFNLFFRVNDLYLGKKMSIYFPTIDKSNSPRLYSREKADSIPFSLSKLSYILDLFTFSKESSQAKSMESTLKQCEHKSDEIKFCATSWESMLEKTHDIMGMVEMKVLNTKILKSNHTLFQIYTFKEKPLEIHTPKMITCHTLAYPYLVYYCHSQEGKSSKLFKTTLNGENGDLIEAYAVCHMDTSSWSPNHMAFRALGGGPGSSPVCHFLPTDNVVWLPSS